MKFCATLVNNNKRRVDLNLYVRTAFGIGFDWNLHGRELAAFWTFAIVIGPILIHLDYVGIP